MKSVITLIIAVLCLGVVVPGTFSQQPTNPPKQKAQAAKATGSADILADLESARKKLESAQKDLANAAHAGQSGGFPEAAMKNIDEAFTNINKAMEFEKNKK